jgi:hypothetical protein
VQFSSHQLPVGQGGGDRGQFGRVQGLGRHGGSGQDKARQGQLGTVNGEVMEPINH